MIFAGGQRIATIGSSGATYYYHTDHLGSSGCDHRQHGVEGSVHRILSVRRATHESELITPVIDVPYKYTGKGAR